MPAVYTIQKPAPGYMHFFYLQPTEVKRLTRGGNKRVICTFQDNYAIHAAIMRNKEGQYFIMIGNQHLKALGIGAGSQVKATLRIDDTEIQFAIPEELTEVMATDRAAGKIFKALSDGNKRGLAALVNMVKSPEKKVERALLIAEKLKKGISSPAKIMQR